MGSPLPTAANDGNGFDETKIRRLISSSIDFYVMALVRNKPMIENTLALLTPAPATKPAGSCYSAPPVAVLVAGGFHTLQLTNMLREKHTSYLVITPTVESLSDADHDLYVKRLSGVHLTAEEIDADAERKSFEWVEAIKVAGGPDLSPSRFKLDNLWPFVNNISPFVGKKEGSASTLKTLAAGFDRPPDIFARAIRNAGYLIMSLRLPRALVAAQAGVLALSHMVAYGQQTKPVSPSFSGAKAARAPARQGRMPVQRPWVPLPSEEVLRRLLPAIGNMLDFNPQLRDVVWAAEFRDFRKAINKILYRLAILEETLQAITRGPAIASKIGETASRKRKAELIEEIKMLREQLPAQTIIDILTARDGELKQLLQIPETKKGGQDLPAARPLDPAAPGVMTRRWTRVIGHLAALALVVIYGLPALLTRGRYRTTMRRQYLLLGSLLTSQGRDRRRFWIQEHVAPIVELASTLTEERARLFEAKHSNLSDRPALADDRRRTAIEMGRAVEQAVDAVTATFAMGQWSLILPWYTESILGSVIWAFSKDPRKISEGLRQNMKIHQIWNRRNRLTGGELTTGAVVVMAPEEAVELQTPADYFGDSSSRIKDLRAVYRDITGCLNAIGMHLYTSTRYLQSMDPSDSDLYQQRYAAFDALGTRLKNWAKRIDAADADEEALADLDWEAVGLYESLTREFRLAEKLVRSRPLMPGDIIAAFRHGPIMADLLRDFHRARLILSRRPLKTNHLDARSWMEELFSASDIRIVAPDGQAPLAVDEAALYKVLLNLTKNARDAKATEVRISLARSQDEKQLLIVVEDNGGGMEEKRRMRVESVVNGQADDGKEPLSTKPTEGGVRRGVGTSIVGWAVRALGAQVSVQSRPNDSEVGKTTPEAFATRFTVALPVNSAISRPGELSAHAFAQRAGIPDRTLKGLVGAGLLVPTRLGRKGDQPTQYFDGGDLLRVPSLVMELHAADSDHHPVRKIFGLPVSESEWKLLSAGPSVPAAQKTEMSGARYRQIRWESAPLRRRGSLVSLNGYSELADFGEEYAGGKADVVFAWSEVEGRFVPLSAEIYKQGETVPTHVAFHQILGRRHGQPAYTLLDTYYKRSPDHVGRPWAEAGYSDIQIVIPELGAVEHDITGLGDRHHVPELWPVFAGGKADVYFEPSGVPSRPFVAARLEVDSLDGLTYHSVELTHREKPPTPSGLSVMKAAVRPPEKGESKPTPRPNGAPMVFVAGFAALVTTLLQGFSSLLSAEALKTLGHLFHSMDPATAPTLVFIVGMLWVFRSSLQSAWVNWAASTSWGKHSRGLRALARVGQERPYASSPPGTSYFATMLPSTMRGESAVDQAQRSVFGLSA